MRLFNYQATLPSSLSLNPNINDIFLHASNKSISKSQLDQYLYRMGLCFIIFYPFDFASFAKSVSNIASFHQLEKKVGKIKIT